MFFHNPSLFDLISLSANVCNIDHAVGQNQGDRSFAACLPVRRLTGLPWSDKVTGMKKRFLTLAVSAVDLADRRFCFSYPHEDPVVTASVRALGVIEPPVLFEHDPPVVISGWRRIWAARRAGINEVPAIVVALPENDCMIMAFETNRGRPLNLVEKAHVLERTLRFGLSEEERGRIMDGMGLQPHRSTVDTLLVLGAADETVKMFVVEKNLSLRNAKSLLRFPGEERCRVVDLITTVPATDSLIREILDLLALLRLKQGSVDYSTLHGCSDGRSLRRRLEELTHPLLASLEQKWDALRAELRLPPSVDIKVDPFFEKEYIDIQFRVRSHEEAQEAQERLRGLVDKGEIRRILDLGSG